jgi:threonylcarbamoyladenosine tRNA methylthiotransferase MtaB
MKVALHTLGCKVNYAETAAIKDKFEQLGYSLTEFGTTADIILINTCSVTNNADVEARKLIRRAKRQSPNAFLGVMGCYAQLKPEEVSQIEGVDAVFGQREKFRVPSLVHQLIGKEQTQVNVSCIEDLPFDVALTTDNELLTRAFL